MTSMISKLPWVVSLHGGHSGPFCDHAVDTLEELLEAAVSAGYHTFGVTEHAPRFGQKWLYPEEVARGWDVATLEERFAAYATEVDRLAQHFDGRLEVLRGFEAEVVPPERYAAIMKTYREKFRFEYIVGSVHHVDGHIIDYSPETYQSAAKYFGSIESLAVRYYQVVAEMVHALQPEVVGHLDLIRRYAPNEASVATDAVRVAANEALCVIQGTGCLLDVNTAGYRKGLGRPYPAPWLVEAAHDKGIEFCFGDDSHSIDDIGAGLPQARQYLLEQGVTMITSLTRSNGALTRVEIPLDPAQTVS